MKFRQRLFWGLAALVALYVVGTLVLAGDSASESTQDCIDRGTLSQEACEAASEIGVGIGATVVLCVGGLLFMFFALLAWRNGAGLANERRHQEQLEAARRE